MCTREMTLGEEIINLTKRGINVSTVERMYRKYIDLDEKGKSEGCYAIDLGPLFPTFDIGDTVRYCRADVEATLNLFRDAVTMYDALVMTHTMQKNLLNVGQVKMDHSE